MREKQVHIHTLRIICFLIPTLLSLTSYSQLILNCDSTNNKKARIMYNEAISLATDNKAGNISLFKKAAKEDTAFAAPNFKLGEIYYYKALKSQYNVQLYSHNSYYFRKAEDHLLRVLELCEELNDFASFFYLGELYFMQREYSLANYYLDYFLNNSSNNLAAAKKAKDYIKKYKLWKSWNDNPSNVIITPLENISTNKDEFLPQVTHNGQYFYFTRRYEKPQLNSIHSEAVEEFIISDNIGTDSSNNWIYSKGEPMGWPFNDGRNQGAVSLSADNSRLFLTICQSIRISDKPFKNCDLYFSDNESGYWAPPENLGNHINTNKTWEAQPSVSSNGNMLFFASERPDAIGGSDLYYCYLDSLGNWSLPINMGEKINTINDEKSPFIHYDNHTLYYASNGKFGLGGYDIFISRLNKNKEWEEPINLGKPFNTSEDEIGFVVDARGTKAYFASNHFPGNGGWDIFRTDLPEEFRPSELFILNGRVVDNFEVPIPHATISIINTNDLNDKIPVNHINGKFSEILPVKNKNFLIKVTARGFTYGNRVVKTENENNGSFEQIELKRIKNGIRFELDNINFESDSYALNFQSKNSLRLFAGYLLNNPDICIKINGYTDNIASNEYNQKLSEKRAEAVFNYLIDMGISQPRLSYEGMGENDPISSNELESYRAKNRRIEIEITAH